MIWFKRFNLPLLLTLIRLCGSPIVLPLMIVYLSSYDLLWVNMCLGIVFMLFGLTDFFDGYLARKYEQVTVVGKLLDPVADKFLLYATLVALLAAGKIYFFWVILLVGREFFVMGLRQVALEHNFSVPVSYLGKIKTTMQMLCLCFIFINPSQPYGLFYAPGWNGMELVLLLLANGFSIWSAKQYGESFMRYLGILAPQKHAFQNYSIRSPSQDSANTPVFVDTTRGTQDEQTF